MEGTWKNLLLNIFVFYHGYHGGCVDQNYCQISVSDNFGVFMLLLLQFVILYVYLSLVVNEILNI